MIFDSAWYLPRCPAAGPRLIPPAMPPGGPARRLLDRLLADHRAGKLPASAPEMGFGGAWAGAA